MRRMKKREREREPWADRSTLIAARWARLEHRNNIRGREGWGERGVSKKQKKKKERWRKKEREKTILPICWILDFCFALRWLPRMDGWTDGWEFGLVVKKEKLRKGVKDERWWGRVLGFPFFFLGFLLKYFNRVRRSINENKPNKRYPGRKVNFQRGAAATAAAIH